MYPIPYQQEKIDPFTNKEVLRCSNVIRHPKQLRGYSPDRYRRPGEPSKAVLDGKVGRYHRVQGTGCQLLRGRRIGIMLKM
jgi:hypothetical protein